MALITPLNEFLVVQQSYGSDPGSSTEMANVVNGTANVKGSWLDLLGTTVTNDSFGIYIRMCNEDPAANVAYPLLFDIGVDPAGGTSYTVLIPNINVSNPNFPAGIGYEFFFPIIVKAGSTLAARSQSSAAADDVRVGIALFQKPTRPEVVRAGTYVETIGANTAASRGTVFTPGTSGAKGSWTSLGTSTKEGWFVQPSFAIDDDSGSQMMYVDYGIGSAGSERVIVPNARAETAGQPQTTAELVPAMFCYHYLPAGTEFFVRGATSAGALDSNYNAVIHVIGG